MSEEASRLQSANPSALPVGTRLGEFELLRLLGVGGFGIVYLAFDHALEREVAVKEYMPASLAGRTETMHVTLRSKSDAETFALGLKSFVNEARLLARFDHPSLLKVHRFWEANGTAYMAMPVMRGRTVKEVRQGMTGAPDEAWMRALLEPLLGAIEKLHSEGVYHRDIAPDNIQIEPDGHPVLLDFGAARRVLSDKSQALTAILKPAYAPIEQYAEAGSVKQGPWTDLYALGATLHYLLLLRPPPPATARAVHDEASLLTAAAVPSCSENFLNIVDWMLAPRPADRPQSVAALRDVLEGRAPTPVRRQPTEPAASDWDRTQVMPPASAAAWVSTKTGATGARDAQSTQVMPRSTTQVPRAAGTTGVPHVSGHDDSAEAPTVMLARPLLQPATASRPAADTSVPAPAAAKPKGLLIGLALGAVVLAVAAAYALTRKPAAPPAVPAEVAAAAAPVASQPVLAPASPPPAASAVPESAVAAVVLPGTSAAPAPATTPTPAPTETTPAPAVVPGASGQQGKPGAAVPLAPSASPRAMTVAKTQPKVTPSSSLPPPLTVAPVQTPPVEVSKPKSEAPAPAPPASVSGPGTDAAKPAATNPETVCGGKRFLNYFACMERECLKSAQMGHADCKKWRANAPKQDQ